MAEFRAISEPRGEALSRPGLVKALTRLGRDQAETATDLDELRLDLERIGLHHARDMADKARAELGIPPMPSGTGKSGTGKEGGRR